MRRVLFSLSLAVVGLTSGCQSGPPSAPSTAADAGSVNPLSRLFRGNPPNAPASAAGPNKAATGPNGAALSQKTKQDLGIESVTKRGGIVKVDFDGLQKYVVFADLHGFYNAAAALEKLA